MFFDDIYKSNKKIYKYNIDDVQNVSAILDKIIKLIN